MAAMEPVTQLANQYKDEFEEVKKQALSLGDTLQAKVQQYQQQLTEMQPAINQQKEELIQTLQDQSELSGIDSPKMMASFTWTGLMLTGLSFGFIISKFLLAPILSLLVSPFYAFIAAYVVVPGLAYYYIVAAPAEGEPKELDQFRRHCLLGVALAEGALNGMLFCQRVIPGLPPPAELTALSIGIGSAAGSSFIGNDRVKLFAVTLGGAFATYFAMGMATGISSGYLVLALLYTVVGFVVLQLYIKKGNAEAMTHVYQLGFLVGVVYAQGLGYAMFGMDPAQVPSE